ncbi:MAG: hypothetical protein ACKVS6_05390 [Planctomycetota bacterium]
MFRRRNNGELIDASVRIAFSRFSLFFGLTLLAMLPMLVFLILMLWVQYYMPDAEGLRTMTEGEGLKMMLAFAGIGVIVLVGFIPSMWWMGWFHGALYVAISRAALGGNPTFREAVRSGRSRAFSLSFVDMLIQMGFACGFIPGFIFAAFFWPAAPVISLENSKFNDALGRSSNLTAGHRWRVLGLFVVMTFLVQMFSGPLMWPFAFVSQFKSLYNMPDWVLPLTAASYAIGIFLSLGLQLFIRVAQTLCYLDLRIRKEGLDLLMDGGVEEAPPAIAV